MNISIEFLKSHFKSLVFPFVVLGSLPQGGLEAQNSLLYEVSGKDLQEPSYVYGTIHMICEDDFFVSESVKTAFSNVKKLFLEIDLSDPSLGQRMQMAMIHPEGKNIKEYLSEEEYTLVDEYLKNQMGMGLGLLGQFKPFALSSMLTMNMLDCEKSKSYELYFVELAKAHEIAIAGLESPESQIAIFDNMPYDEQVRELVKAIKNPEEGEEEFAKMMEYYIAQDAQSMYDEVILENPMFIKYQEELLNNRNRNWIPIMLANMMKESTFVAVGAGHLAGENGVLELLRKAGYTVKAIN